MTIKCAFPGCGLTSDNQRTARQNTLASPARWIPTRDTITDTTRQPRRPNCDIRHKTTPLKEERNDSDSSTCEAQPSYGAKIPCKSADVMSVTRPKLPWTPAKISMKELGGDKLWAHLRRE